MAYDGELAQLCQEQGSRLSGLFLLYVSNPATAEELAQDCMVKICENWPRLRAMDNPQGWVTTTALNIGRSHWRRLYAEARARRRHGSSLVTIDAADTASAMTVRRAVAGLPRRQREALVLRHWMGLSITETAELMKCSEGTVKTHASRARDALRRQLEDEHEGSSGARDAASPTDPEDTTMVGGG